ncbi:uncharacterized protein A4U43_C01F14880 [Asparagus officinalis]|uniref:Uncharacterized protein n=1 Tax=Asparagus officinalis TaxID=4686 RepID=A0A5P1FPN1_ASPOF|nr:uncharacterized protein A4U43_C01F14880 [Asparagus officinalis]
MELQWTKRQGCGRQHAERQGHISNGQSGRAVQGGGRLQTMAAMADNREGFVDALGGAIGPHLVRGGDIDEYYGDSGSYPERD